MTAALTVLRTLVALFVVMGLGALLRRRGIVGADGARSLARLVADVAFPALCLRGLAELGAEALLRGWVVVLLGFATLVVSAGVGEATGRALGVGKGALPSVVFGVTMGNWIFFPLPIAEALHGSEGAGVVLLHNAGAQLYLWTFGVGRLVGRGAREGARAIATNPGLWATLAGFVLAAAWPGAAHAPILGDVLGWIGGLTVPLATLAVGAELAGKEAGAVDLGLGARRGRQRALGALVLGRLVAAPVVVAAVLYALLRAGVLERRAFLVEVLVASMPISLTAGALVARARGADETRSFARAILVTTAASLASVPVAYVLAEMAAGAAP